VKSVYYFRHVAYVRPHVINSPPTGRIFVNSDIGHFRTKISGTVHEDLT